MYIEFIVFSIGLVFGSFGNNIISYFVNGNKFDLGRSHCFCGEYKLKSYELIPLLSFLFLKGSCSKCNRKISSRYLLVELMSGILSVSIYIKFDLSIIALIYFLAFYIMLVIAFIDYKKFIIPNRLLVILLVIAIINLLLSNEQIVIKVVVSIVVTISLIILNFFYMKKRTVDAIGYGDIKYLAIIMLLFSFPSSLLGLWISSIIALLIFSLLQLFQKDSRYKNKIPLGTYISIGYFITILTDGWLIRTYKHLFMDL